MVEIKITNANNFQKFICFKVNGLEDGITVGIVADPNSHEQALSIAYKGETIIVPFNATSEDIKQINDNYEEENLLEDMFENGKQIKIGNLYADKESYDWLTYPSEEDDEVGYWQPSQVTELDEEAFEEFYKDVTNPEIDKERVEAAKKIFEGIDKVSVLEMMDDWGVNGNNYNDFRNVIKEHCFDKGIYDINTIEKTWKEFQKSLEEAIKSIKEGMK